MKLKKNLKRISATLLAATMVVSALPNQPKVHAEEFPEEILFPVSILDLRADNLFIEYPSNGVGNTFAALGSNGKGFVEDKLEQDPTSIYYGLPVYKQATVKKIAELTQGQLGRNDNTNINVLNNQYISGIINPLSLRNYVRKTDWVVLDAEDTGKYKIDYTNSHYGGIKHYSELGGGAEIVGGNNTLQQYYVTNIGGPDKGTVTFKYYNEAGKGNYNIRIFAMSDTDDKGFKVTVGASTYNVVIGNTGSLDTPSQNATYTLTSVPLVDGENTIIFEGISTTDIAPNLDRIEIGTGKVETEIVVEAENNRATIKTQNWQQNTRHTNYVSIGGWNEGYSTPVNNIPARGQYDVTMYYKKNGNENYNKVGVNGNYPNDGTWIPNNNNFNNNPIIFSGLTFNKGNNTLSYQGNNVDIDKFVITKASSGGDYPLGTYAESKAKYNIDRINNTTGAEEPDGIADYGWYDIETCYDYAYFITAHMFKYHPSLNKPYSDYNNLIFHKVEGSDTTPYYEFKGDQHHKGNDDGLIYNPGKKSIRNGSADKVVAAEGEFRTRAGEMFIVDKATKDYPSIDKDYNNSTGKHNFHYSVRTHSRFVYKKGSGQTFYFSGDDDVYVFINGQMIIDLGGAHTQIDGTFNLDDIADANPALDLKNGKAVDFDFYYVERHTTESNFYGKMNFKLANDEVSLEWPEDIKNLDELSIPYGWVVDLNYRFESNRELTTNKNITFTDQLSNTIGAKGFELKNGVRLRDDKKLTVTVVRDGKPDPEVHEFIFADTTANTDADAAVKNQVIQFFKDLELEQGDSVSIDGIIFDSAIRSFDSYTETEDPRVRSMYFETRADYDMYMTMGGTNTIDDTVAIPNHVTNAQTVNMLMGALKVSCKVEGLGENYDVRDDLSAYGKFTLSRPETKDDPATPDVDESIVYQNQMDLAKGEDTIIFDSVIPDPKPTNIIYEKAIPRGRYKLNMDTSVLTGYDLSVEIKVTKPDGNVIDVEVMKGESKVLDGESYSFDTLYLDIEPKIIGGKWVYPEVEYILKAVRKVNPLKDLT